MKKTIAVFLIVCMMAGAGWCQPEMPPAGEPPQSGQAGQAVLTQEDSGKVTLDLRGMDVIEVIKMLAAKGKLNIIIGPNVKGRVTIFLKSVELMDAFDIILVANELAYDRRGDIIYVMTQREYEMIYGERYSDKKEVRIFQLKNAKAAEAAKALNQMKTKVGRVVVDEGSNTIVVIDSPASVAQIAMAIGKIDTPTVTRVFELKYARVADLKTKVGETVTKDVGRFQIDERTNKIVITDVEKKMPELSDMIAAFDSKLQQVLIEAKIVTVTLDDHYQLGVDWDALITKINKEVLSKAISFQGAFQLAAQNALVPGAQMVIGTLGSTSDYALMLQVLKTVGDTNLLSSPRITALNNQEAKILVGKSQPYATNTVTQGTATTTTGTNLSFMDIGIKLFVTPTINQDGFVSMKIKPEVSSQNGTYTYGTPATTVPVVETTQAETSVTIKDGMTIIIGGLIKDQRIKTVNKIPLLGDIPMFGALFSKTDDQVVKQELVIFLTPHIITGEADYIKSPLSPPVGESLFTSPEKPAFERRRPVKLNPTIFAKDKDAWFRNEHTAAGDSGSQDAFAANAVSSFGTDDEYYYAVKRKIVDRIKLPKVAKGPANNVKVEFTLSPAGKITRGPDVLQSSNRKLDDACRNAVRRAAPYPAFPQSFGTAEKRFVIDIVAEK